MVQKFVQTASGSKYILEGPPWTAQKQGILPHGKKAIVAISKEKNAFRVPPADQNPSNFLGHIKPGYYIYYGSDPERMPTRSTRIAIVEDVKELVGAK